MSELRKHVDLAVKAVDAAGRRFVGVASQQIVDRDGDVIVARGIDRSRFERNPVLLGDHDPSFVLGSVRRTWTEGRPDGEALMFEAEVLPAGASARVDEAWAGIVFGARRGISIGFRPLEADPRPLLAGQTGYTFKRVELYEISSVSIPSCPTCLVEQKRFKAAALPRPPRRNLSPEAARLLEEAERRDMELCERRWRERW